MAQPTPAPSTRKPKRTKLYLIFGVIAVVAVGTAAIIKGKGGEQATLVTFDKVVVRTITQTVSATGKIQPEVEVKIQPEVGGEIMELAEREIEKAIARWRLARSLGYWPGHTGKFVRAEAPAFLESNRMEREVAYDEAVKAAGGERALFEASFRRQSPDPRKKLAAIDDEEVL